MALKRQGAIQTYHTMPLAKRLRRVERVQARRKPESKYAVFTHSGAIADMNVTTVELTAIAQGSDVSERTGNHIKLLRCDVRGDVGDNNLDYYIIQCHTTSAPGYSNFNAQQGGAISTIDNNTKFTEWKYMSGYKMKDVGRLMHRFKYGIKCKFNGTASSNCVDNRVFLFIKNNTGASHSPNLTVRVWFTDG